MSLSHNKTLLEKIFKDNKGNEDIQFLKEVYELANEINTLSLNEDNKKLDEDNKKKADNKSPFLKKALTSFSLNKEKKINKDKDNENLIKLSKENKINKFNVMNMLISNKLFSLAAVKEKTSAYASTMVDEEDEETKIVSKKLKKSEKLDTNPQKKLQPLFNNIRSIQKSNKLEDENEFVTAMIDAIEMLQNSTTLEEARKNVNEIALKNVRNVKEEEKQYKKSPIITKDNIEDETKKNIEEEKKIEEEAKEEAKQINNQLDQIKSDYKTRMDISETVRHYHRLLSNGEADISVCKNIVRQAQEKLKKLGVEKQDLFEKMENFLAITGTSMDSKNILIFLEIMGSVASKVNGLKKYDSELDLTNNEWPFKLTENAKLDLAPFLRECITKPDYKDVVRAASTYEQPLKMIMPSAEKDEVAKTFLFMRDSIKYQGQVGLQEEQWKTFYTNYLTLENVSFDKNNPIYDRSMNLSITGEINNVAQEALHKVLVQAILDREFKVKASSSMSESEIEELNESKSKREEELIKKWSSNLNEEQKQIKGDFLKKVANSPNFKANFDAFTKKALEAMVAMFSPAQGRNETVEMLLEMSKFINLLKDELKGKDVSKMTDKELLELAKAVLTESGDNLKTIKSDMIERIDNHLQKIKEEQPGLVQTQQAPEKETAPRKNTLTSSAEAIIRPDPGWTKARTESATRRNNLLGSRSSDANKEAEKVAGEVEKEIKAENDSPNASTSASTSSQESDSPKSDMTANEQQPARVHRSPSIAIGRKDSVSAQVQNEPAPKSNLTTSAPAEPFKPIRRNATSIRARKDSRAGVMYDQETLQDKLAQMKVESARSAPVRSDHISNMEQGVKRAPTMPDSKKGGLASSWSNAANRARATASRDSIEKSNAEKTPQQIESEQRERQTELKSGGDELTIKPNTLK